MKKLLAMLGVAGLFLVSLTGCPSPTTSSTTTTTTTTQKTKETTTEKTPKETEHKGSFEKFAGDKLTIKADGKDKDFDVKGVEPMVDGKKGKYEDIKEKAAVTITEKDGKVTKVEAKNPAAEDKKDVETKGTFEKFDKDKLTIKADGKEKEFDVKGVKPMVDGKEGKYEDIKEKATVTVTEKEGKVTKVEAKNP